MSTHLRVHYRYFKVASGADLTVMFLTNDYFNNSITEGHRILSKRIVDAILSSKTINVLVVSLESIKHAEKDFILGREMAPRLMDWLVHTIKIFEKLKKHKVNLIHILSYNKLFPTILNLRDEEPGLDRVRKMVAHLYYHPRCFKDLRYKPMEILIRMRFFDAILTTSLSLRNYIRQEIGLGTDSVLYVPPVVPKEYLNFDYHLSRSCSSMYKKRLGLDEKNFVVLYMGHIIPQRGVFELVSAFSKASRSNSSLRLVISHTNIIFKDLTMDYLSLLYKMIKKHDLENKVVVIGKQNPLVLYNLSDVLFFGFDDSFYFTYPPLVVCEAMSAGMPFIMKYSSLVNELFKGRVQIPIYRDIDELTEILSSIAHDRSLYDHFVKIKKYTGSMFSPELFASRMIKIYSKLLESWP